MKHFMSILVLLMAFSTPVFGQHTVSVRWSGNLTIITGLHGGTAHRSIGIGAFVSMPLQNRFSIQVGCDYVQKGITNDSYYNSLSLVLNYLEFSGIGVVAILSPRPTFSLSILAGPTLAIKVNHRGEEPLSKRFNRDPFEFHTLDFGITGGVGLQTKIQEMIIKTELRYTRGIRSINKSTFYILELDYENETVIEELGRMKNQAISFSISLGFIYGARVTTTR